MDKEKSTKPPFATGFIVDDYRPLFIYWRIARSNGREDLIEKSMPSTSDLEYLVDKVSKGRNLGDLLNELTHYLENRIDPEIAFQAAREAGYVNIDRSRSQELISRILAGWIIEMGESTGRVKISSRRRE